MGECQCDITTGMGTKSYYLKEFSMARLELNDISVIVRLQVVTPDLATEWLKDHKNRQLKSRRVRDYGIDMAKGKWEFNGEPLIFDDKGNLMDGQHRLHAIINTNTSHIMLIVTGVKEGVFSTIDGGLSRQPLDHLHVAGYTHAALLAAALRVVDDIRSGEITTVNRNKAYGTRVIDAAEEYDGMGWCCEEAERLNRSAKLLPGSLIAGFKWVFDHIDPSLCDRFWAAILCGDHVDSLPACGIFRNRLISNKGATTKLSRGQLAILIVLTWNAACRGNHRPALRIMSNEFPKIHGYNEGIFNHGK